MRTQSPTAAAQALGLARRTVARLRDGYWPRNPEKIVRAWRTYAGHLAEQRSGWFLRRVYAGGVVRHARAAWGSPALAARVGQVLVCTRAADGALLAQTLALPAERFLLAPVTNA
ncbi:MAG: hypothetical protein EPN34_03095 [Burkholderiaceae bacterium]|nr:MAG: hypothetical protein EPN34_03095 [Burkholderiaceae bacterium]